MLKIEVSKALEPILFPRDNQFKMNGDSHSPKDTVERLAAGRRRSSLVNLFQFVNGITKLQTVKKAPANTFSGSEVSVSEAFSKFQFRSTTSGPQISSNAAGSEDHQLAVSRRKRMHEYNERRRRSVFKPRDVPKVDLDAKVDLVE